MAPTGRPIFLDPTGRRAWSLRLGAALVAIAALLLLGLFIGSVARSPKMAIFGAAPTHQPPLLKRPAKKLAAARKALFAQIEADRRGRILGGAPVASQIAGGYFSPWRDTGMESFRAHAADLTHVYPAWIELAKNGKSITTDFWTPDRSQTTKDLVRIARADGVRIVPVLQNAEAGQFDRKRLLAMLNDKAAAEAVLQSLVQFLAGNGYQGLQLDFELLDAPTVAKLAPWMRRLASALHARGLEFSTTLEYDLDDASTRALAATADYAVLMAYDEHENTGAPGPVASAGYTERTLKRFGALVSPDKLILGVGAYGYDWNVKEKDAEAITNQAAIGRASRYRAQDKPQDAIDFDPVALEPTFQYVDERSDLHEVWFLDAVTTKNALTLARAYRTRGAALWALGMEDPSVWKVFGRHGSLDADLHTVIIPQQVDFIGDGELLRVVRRPQPGARTYDVNRANGLIDDEDYTAYPSGWLVVRSGAPEDTVALTFDDGPDPTWTPKILDVLKKHGVKATFFMIGEPVVDHPDLVRRVYAEGHEIGSHSFTHPNMAHVSEERVRLELAATQRAFEAVLGRSVVLFRPPYNADSEPRSYGEIMPIAVADAQGYVTAGETIDPNDWDIFRKNPDGSRRRLTGADVENSVLAHLNYGQAVLMHDGGGDRSATLAALDGLITTLQARGYHFDTIGELEGRTRDQTMPKIPPGDRAIAQVDAVAFTVRRVFNTVLFWGFSFAIALGLLRVALMIGLAARPARVRPDAAGSPLGPAGGGVRVDALVAAFNEAPVIARTVSSLLASRGADVRVIVVDDGSTDGTGDIVEAAFGGDPRVRIARKENGGKASALNMALSLSDAPVVVGVDADTQLAPDALALLARWFVDPAIGAAAGNVKVGNRTRLVTRWQSLEYVTSQNVDRRAMSRLNAITVVPGAIGGYRADALRAVGGYRSDTLAEDMDLTWRLRRAGWTVVNESKAYAYTEAPDTLRGLMRQRFRWTFGTLQCLWKHRTALFHYGWFGGLALPTLWVFQFLAQILAPFVDLQLVTAVIGRTLSWIATLQHADISAAPDPTLWVVVAIYAAFMALEIAAGWIAYAFDAEDKRELWLLPTQRFVYRQIMYIVVWRALFRALGGVGQGWGKLKRTGAVRLRETAETQVVERQAARVTTADA